jgi:MFS transporter, ACS family, glucarate transporter
VALQGRANGLVLAAIGLGSSIAPPLVTALMVRWGWRAALLASALPALAAAAGWLAVRRLPQPIAAGAGNAGAAGRLTSRSFVLLTASYTLQGYVGYIFVFWFYLYLVEVRHFDLLRGALLSSLPGLLSIVSIPLGGWISDALVRRAGMDWGRRAVPMAGLIGGSAFLAYGARTENAWAAAICLALATALVLSVEGPFWASMMEIAGSRSGAAGGTMNMGCNVAGFISPALTPVLAASLGWQNALYLAAALSTLGGLLWLGVTVKPSSR